MTVDSFRPERTETIAVQGCAAIFKGSRPLKMKKSKIALFDLHLTYPMGSG
jgi:hypothetical protein